MNVAAHIGGEGSATERFRALAPGVPLFESPFFERFADEAFPESEINAIARKLNRDGYAIFDFPETEFERVADGVMRDLAGRFDQALWKSFGWTHQEGQRVQDAWRFSADVKRIACNGAVLSLLARLFGRRCFPFNTLNFPVGTQQHFHSDSVHFSTIPERFMCGVWVALEDIAPEAGPLVFYPGSHKLPVLYNEILGVRVFGSAFPSQDTYHAYWEALVEQHALKPVTFTAKKGQALIWSANLLHGGAAQSDPERTRWSQVTHYFAEDCVYVRPMTSDPMTGNLHLADVTDITTGKEAVNRYCGMPLSKIAPHLNPQRDPRLSPDRTMERIKRAVIGAGLLNPARSVRRLIRGRSKTN